MVEQHGSAYHLRRYFEELDRAKAATCDESHFAHVNLAVLHQHAASAHMMGGDGTWNDPRPTGTTTPA
ncbi:hypothetical protein [Sphingomonas montana]|uniref:hypothetical protein n=1 Tax=Sphingomonas montana TaxID=1843236 RepID=UPI00096F13E0|nr:hypothetical protein [Sphingomonas montana]